MRLCSCGFANDDAAHVCVACGNPLAREGNAPEDPSTAGLRPSTQDDTEEAPRPAPDLLLEDLRAGTVVRITAPGGILGRAGDFSPDVFSSRVSGVHAVVAASPDGRWTIEHTGRNESSVLRGNAWSSLHAGAPQPLFGGETLKLADMVFRVAVEAPEAAGSFAEATAAAATSDAGGDASATSRPAACAEAVAWSVRCPVCGTEHAVADADGRVDACTFCSDPFDRAAIARVSARPRPVA
ncbi:FHA domain-containing protein [Adlercreutzia sp. R25]|uniref:FHA domain-containing protein n=1 Tax=Adlercreutzia shanghongiae TaxID=3111773 RepID=A0ABU6IYW3_9ACTN|nr:MULTISPECIES: FHA domain-containing protein [unclassified Adlercreutzia]MEC4272881.1 FHA domain-containing protein [Adlercreutzia sp. R25]MEC4295004.1 FHA domain-containing protein [Adlercreutzia sp. R22]